VSSLSFNTVDTTFGSAPMKVKPTVRRELATRHRYGPDIARGPYVYVAYDGDKLVAVAATAGEARKLYSKAWIERMVTGKTG
jgi:hypothetical protein